MVEGWFSARGWVPADFQREAWEHAAAGRSGLIQVATGAGKTYAAFMGGLISCIDEWRDRDEPPRGPRVLYLTPLRAVARDIESALRRPCEDLKLPLRVGARTGDTSATERSRQRGELPQVLVTTPESLTLLLMRDGAAETFGGVVLVVVDEWHELLASKRGTQTELALARLRRIAPRLRTWALSATLENLEQAAAAAVGIGCDPVIVRGRAERPTVIRTLLPEDTRLPWAGHMGFAMLPAVLGELDPSVSTLVFLNTRAQAELWYQAIWHSRPDWREVLALHHGSVDRAARERAERGLKDGSVRIVVATSSLDLGVDFAPVERVFQIGSCKGLARLLQRAGRSGHRPGAECRVVCVPTHGIELLEISAARRALASGRIEPRTPPDKPLDVLVQHIVTRAMGDGFRADELFEEVRSAFSYSSLTREEFDWCLALVRDGGRSLYAYEEHHRIEERDDGPGPRYRVRNARVARAHRLNVGTIVSEMTLDLRLISGKRIGSIEDYYIGKLHAGDRFVFAGRVLEFVGIRGTAAVARPATGRTTATPHWAGTRLPISESLSEAVRAELEHCARGVYDAPELEAARSIVEAQRAISAVPSADELLVELTHTREGNHLFIYPFEGRLVNAGLAALLALRLSRRVPTTFSTAANDYGLELLTADDLPFESMLTPQLFEVGDLAREAEESLNLGELARTQFREVARVSGLVAQNYPGVRKTGRQAFSTASLMYDVFREFEPDNLLLQQARREVLQRQYEASRLARTLSRLARAKVIFRVTDRPTPLGFPLVLERVGERLSSETLQSRVEKMKQSWFEAIQPRPSPAHSRGKSRARRSS